VWSSILPADKNARILDAGCGSDSLVWWMPKRGYERSGGIDVSAEQVQIANALGVRNVVEGNEWKERRDYCRWIVPSYRHRVKGIPSSCERIDGSWTQDSSLLTMVSEAELLRGTSSPT
jgi:hypothetical protein